MRTRALFAGLLVISLTAAGGVFALDYVRSPPEPSEYNTTTVTAVDEANGTQLTAVDVRIADTFSKRYTGLSNTTSLDDGEGMLFIHDDEDQYSYVMRNMDFPLDIVFVDANGTITRIHHAPLDPPGTSEAQLTRYTGYGKYVLEVPMGYTNRTGISEGDTLLIPNETAGENEPMNRSISIRR
ncbi:hypothetical protein AUR64_06810 [Haloprofundus marisrubri]|uniref:DUF192 domain-containing protein n=1 Tax=Haloprofundus marisrubri TaxID=1514971 RepID=A0A0W1RCE6_9EURY|nr:hypothetical protein AUR64_06810 [Haloprofundus marisrubri]